MKTGVLHSVGPQHKGLFGCLKKPTAAMYSNVEKPIATSATCWDVLDIQGSQSKTAAGLDLILLQVIGNPRETSESQCFAGLVVKDSAAVLSISLRSLT